MAINDETDVMATDSEENDYLIIKGFNQILYETGFINLPKDYFNEIKTIFKSSIVKKSNDGFVDENDEQNLTSEEQYFCNKYRCAGIYYQTCVFATDDKDKFQKHIDDVHDLNCFDCIEQFSNKSIPPTDDLINHINIKHSKSRYQCNHCFHRTSTIHQLIIHFCLQHSNDFIQTLKLAIIESDDPTDSNDSDIDHEKRRIFEKQFLETFASSEDEENFKKCRIIELRDGYDNDFVEGGESLKIDSLTKKEKKGLHCYFCVKEGQAENSPRCDSSRSSGRFLKHFITFHNHFPIVAVSLPNEQEPDKFQKEPKEAFKKFKEFLETESMGSRWDDEFLALVLKSIDATVSKKNRNKRSVDDEVDSNENSSNKRKRFTLWPSISWTNSLRVAGTVISALGFYQFAQYLPQTIQRFIEN